MTQATATKEKGGAYGELKARLRESATLGLIGSLVGWDQETMMPPKGAAFRAEQMSALAKLVHERETSPRMGELISVCEGDKALLADEGSAANVREMRRDYDRATKLPTELVTELSETCSRAMHVWREARQQSDFKAFQPWLEKVVALSRRKAECYGKPAGGALYDALLDEYEPGASSAEIERIFRPLRERLTPLITSIAKSGRTIDESMNRVKVPVERQKALAEFVARAVGYDFEGGRLDVSTHPFSETVGIGDSRITARFKEDRITDPLATTLHEAGHGMYEQGLPLQERLGQPLGKYCSLGIHESQSRMWENQVGRSRAFWTWLLPHMKKTLGVGFEGIGVDQAYAASNRVRPTFIRVESDEATYNLHVMLRFDIERAMLHGELAVKDLPAAWNERMKNDLGLIVTEDRLGCLQDIHWSMGSIGYFPTYTMGNLYAAQMWETIRRDMPGLDGRIEKGEFAPLLAWLREKIHTHGRRHRAAELCKRVTGKAVSHEPLCNYLEAKLRPLYGL